MPIPKATAVGHGPTASVHAARRPRSKNPRQDARVDPAAVDGTLNQSSTE